MPRRTRRTDAQAAADAPGASESDSTTPISGEVNAEKPAAPRRSSRSRSKASAKNAEDQELSPAPTPPNSLDPPTASEKPAKKPTRRRKGLADGEQPATAALPVPLEAAAPSQPEAAALDAVGEASTPTPSRRRNVGGRRAKAPDSIETVTAEQPTEPTEDATETSRRSRRRRVGGRRVAGDVPVEAAAPVDAEPQGSAEVSAPTD